MAGFRTVCMAGFRTVCMAGFRTVCMAGFRAVCMAGFTDALSAGDRAAAALMLPPLTDAGLRRCDVALFARFTAAGGEAARWLKTRPARPGTLPEASGHGAAHSPTGGQWERVTAGVRGHPVGVSRSDKGVLLSPPSFF